MDQRFVTRDETAGGERLVLAVVLAVANGGVEATVLAPFGLLLEPGLRLRADDGQPVTLAFETCYPDGCIARGALDEATLAAFRAGDALHVEADAQGDNGFRLEGSLRGFSAAIDRLRAKRADPSRARHCSPAVSRASNGRMRRSMCSATMGPTCL